MKKKYIILITSITAVMALVGCGKKVVPTTSSKEETPTTSKQETPTTSEAAKSSEVVPSSEEATSEADPLNYTEEQFYAAIKATYDAKNLTIVSDTIYEGEVTTVKFDTDSYTYTEHCVDAEDGSIDNYGYTYDDAGNVYNYASENGNDFVLKSIIPMALTGDTKDSLINDDRRTYDYATGLKVWADREKDQFSFSKLEYIGGGVYKYDNIAAGEAKSSAAYLTFENGYFVKYVCEAVYADNTTKTFTNEWKDFGTTVVPELHAYCEHYYEDDEQLICSVCGERRYVEITCGKPFMFTMNHEYSRELTTSDDPYLLVKNYLAKSYLFSADGTLEYYLSGTKSDGAYTWSRSGPTITVYKNGEKQDTFESTPDSLLLKETHYGVTTSYEFKTVEDEDELDMVTDLAGKKFKFAGNYLDYYDEVKEGDDLTVNSSYEISFTKDDADNVSATCVDSVHSLTYTGYCSTDGNIVHLFNQYGTTTDYLYKDGSLYTGYTVTLKNQTNSTREIYSVILDPVNE